MKRSGIPSIARLPGTLRVVVRLVALSLVFLDGRVCDASAQPLQIRIIQAATSTSSTLPHYVAADLGWFDAAGLSVQEVAVAGDPNAVRALLADAGEVANVGPLTLYTAIAEGARIRVVGDAQARADYELVVRDRFLSLQALETARVATAGPTGMTTELVLALMRKHGADPTNMSFVSIGGHSARLTAVLAAKVDATLVSTLHAAKGKSLGGVHVLTSIAEEFPNFGYTAFAVRTETLADPPKRMAVQTYLKLVALDGVRFIRSSPDRAAEIMQRRVPDMPLSLVREAVHRLNHMQVWAVNGGLDPTVTAYTVKLAREMGLLKRDLTVQDIHEAALLEAIRERASK